jgi:type VI secretion system protein ImpA
VASHAALQEALEAVNRLDQFLTNTLGAGNTISFEGAQKMIQQILTVLAPYLPGAAASAMGSDLAGSAEGAASEQSTAIAVRGAIRSRQDVTRALDAICEYYQQVEPCSPVPFLLRRAQLLANMNFVQAVQELNLASVDALRPSMGSVVDGQAPAAPAPAS